jgi:hypothetical protein
MLGEQKKRYFDHTRRSTTWLMEERSLDGQLKDRPIFHLLRYEILITELLRLLQLILTWLRSVDSSGTAQLDVFGQGLKKNCGYKKWAWWWLRVSKAKKFQIVHFQLPSTRVRGSLIK